MQATGVLAYPITVSTSEDVDRQLARIREAAAHLRQWIAEQSGDPLALLRALKFSKVGLHPVGHHRLNAVEQINQTWSYAVALLATRKLLELHSDADGYCVAPGAHMAIPLDIMSRRPNFVGAEVFAAVHPRNNGKLARDLEKLAHRPEVHRYVFFSSPAYPDTRRRLELEGVEGVQVWSVDLD